MIPEVTQSSRDKKTFPFISTKKENKQTLKETIVKILKCHQTTFRALEALKKAKSERGRLLNLILNSNNAIQYNTIQILIIQSTKLDVIN